jgi:hypothetical protein
MTCAAVLLLLLASRSWAGPTIEFDTPRLVGASVNASTHL